QKRQKAMGIRSSYNMTDAVRMSLNAGADLINISHTAEEQEEGLKAIYDDLVSGKVKESRVDESIGRMEAVRRKYCRTSPEKPESRKTFGGFKGWLAEDMEILRKTSRKSLTLIKDDGFFSGEALKDDPRLLILHLRRPEQFIGENTVSGGEPVEVLKKAFPLASYRKLRPEAIKEDLSSETVRAEEWDRILVICSDLFIHPEGMDFLKDLLQSPVQTAVAVMRTPYEAGELTGADALILSYEDTLPAYLSLTEFLKGEIRAEGSCPVRIPGLEGQEPTKRL
ncbi:MAG: hypothetical protein PQJ58_02495, partial [Spirochaetales bacterium]|nr:hypothetical protein [Spirochaetales bacterium]